MSYTRGTRDIIANDFGKSISISHFSIFFSCVDFYA